MKINNYRKVPSKWLKTEVMLKNSTLAHHIPETRKLTLENLTYMIKKHKRIVLKPIVGTGGSGIIFIQKSGENYTLRYSSQTKKYKVLTSLHAQISRISGGKKYLIQQGIDLLQVNGRPIDFRIRSEKPNHSWKMTRSIGRVARKGLLVTNLAKGGYKLTLEQGLKKALRKNNVSVERNKMIKLAKLGTAIMEKHFPGVRRLGFDFGLDKNGAIWIFEVNTKPA